MNNTIALLAFFAVTAASAQTPTFVTQKKSGTRTEIEISGQAFEPALRELHALAEKRAHPQKLSEGKAFNFDLGLFTKMGKGLRVHFESQKAGEITLKRKGRKATITFRKQLAQSLYALMEAYGWDTSSSQFYIAISPSRSLQCDVMAFSDEVYCTMYLDHVLQ